MALDNVQHFRVKLLARDGGDPDLHQAIPVFHRWIRDRRLPESAIDVSDYLHVPAGPGVILVCHEAIYGLDLEKNRLGLMYNRRTAVSGSAEEKLRQAVGSASAAAAWMEAEPEFSGKLAFDRTRWEVVVNDRALAPNTPETFNALLPAVTRVFDAVVGAGKYQVTHHAAPAELFRAIVSPA